MYKYNSKTKHFVLIHPLSKLRSSFHIQQFSVTRNGDMNNTLQNLINIYDQKLNMTLKLSYKKIFKCNKSSEM